jgi:hypothetical protein
LTPAQRKAKANEEKQLKERQIQEAEQVQAQERKVQKALRSSSPKKEGVPKLSKLAQKKKKAKSERDGDDGDRTAGMNVNVGSALMTSTRRTQNIERRISQRVKQQQRAAVAATAGGNGGVDQQQPLSPKYVQSPDTSLPLSEWTTVSHLSGVDGRLVAEVDSEGHPHVHRNTRSMSEREADEVSMSGKHLSESQEPEDGGDGGGGEAGEGDGRRQQGRKSVLPRGAMWQLRESDRQVKRTSERNLLLETWSQFDADGSGILDQAEIHTLVTKLGRRLSDQHVTATLQGPAAAGR